MRRLISSTFLTLDGVMQGPGGPEEDTDGGFSHGGWSVNHWDESMGAFMDEFMTPPFDMILGRRTYDIFAAHWPHAPEEDGGAPLNAATKYVASRRPVTLEWENSVLIQGDAAEGIANLKETDGPELKVHGSSELLQTLIAHDLIDEYRLLVFPVVVGKGKRLFADGAVPATLELVDSRVASTGVVMAVYRPAGALTTGSFALDQ